MKRTELSKKLSPITSQLLKEKGYISFVDVFIKLGYLDPKDAERWRLKQVPYLEKVIRQLPVNTPLRKRYNENGTKYRIPNA